MVKIVHEFQRIDVNNDHSSKLHYTDQANLSMNQPFTNNPRSQTSLIIVVNTS